MFIFPKVLDGNLLRPRLAPGHIEPEHGRTQSWTLF